MPVLETTSLGLPLGLEAPVVTPNVVIIIFLSFFRDNTTRKPYKGQQPHNCELALLSVPLVLPVCFCLSSLSHPPVNGTDSGADVQ